MNKLNFAIAFEKTCAKRVMKMNDLRTLIKTKITLVIGTKLMFWFNLNI